jgi:hypothetical protein
VGDSDRSREDDPDSEGAPADHPRSSKVAPGEGVSDGTMESGRKKGADGKLSRGGMASTLNRSSSSSSAAQDAVGQTANTNAAPSRQIAVDFNGASLER